MDTGNTVNQSNSKWLHVAEAQLEKTYFDWFSFWLNEKAYRFAFRGETNIFCVLCPDL